MNVFDKELNTLRIKLRRINRDDLADMYEYTSNPSVVQFLEWDEHTDFAETEKFILRTIEDYNTRELSFIWGIEYVKDSKLIGAVRIYDYVPDYGRAEISYVINPAYQHMGIMSEALLAIYHFCFTDLSIVRIQAKSSTFNYSSIRLMEKTGMIREGCLRMYLKLNGIHHDSYLYAITSDDYFSKNPI